MMRTTGARQLARLMCAASQQHTATKPGDGSSSVRQALLISGLVGLSAVTTVAREERENSIGAFGATAQCEANKAPLVYSGDKRPQLVLDGERFAKLEGSSSSSLATRFSCATYRANAPIEDRFDVQATPNGDVYAAVFDGHGGWQISAFVSKALIGNVQKELTSLISEEADTGGVLTQDQVSAAIQRAFGCTDRELMAKVAPAFELGFGAVARCGSCALFALVHDGFLYVANAGDSRAVLGKKDPANKNKMIALPLSRDQNAMVQFEQEKLVREHPGEADAFVCRSPDSCYVKGALQPTRAFGDFSLKYSEFNGPPYDAANGGDRSAGHHTPAPFSPPYITAIPETKSFKVDAKNDAFVIIGSDGLWDFLTNEEAVKVVREQIATGNFDHAGEALVEKTLRHAAKKHGISYEELLELPPGNPRRPVHDDTTVIVLFLN